MSDVEVFSVFSGVYNANRVGPSRLTELQEADFGRGFRMPYFAQLFPLIHEAKKLSVEGSPEEKSKSEIVLSALRGHGLMANCLVLWPGEGMVITERHYSALAVDKSEKIQTGRFGKKYFERGFYAPSHGLGTLVGSHHAQGTANSDFPNIMRYYDALKFIGFDQKLDKPTLSVPIVQEKDNELVVKADTDTDVLGYSFGCMDGSEYYTLYLKEDHNG